MCGIIGYVGNKKATSVILEGLRRLEYRGYDSAGLAVLDGGTLSIHKEKGKIAQLAHALNGHLLCGSLGIGHTRWATHGEPNKINAHPHTDCTRKIVVVHNGIVENYQVLKERLRANNHRFCSDTDSEVIAHLIEDHLDDVGDFMKAVRLTLQELEGTYALAILYKDTPHRFIAARKGSPLIIGMGDKENFVASDIPAILKYTKRMLILSDFQIADVTPQKITVQDLEGKELRPHIEEIQWSLEEAERGGYPHFMLKEIYDQPQVMRKLLGAYTNLDDNRVKFDEIFLEQLKYTEQDLHDIKRIIVQACGTSYHSGLVGKYLFSSYSKIHSHVEMSSEFRYHPIIADPSTLLISITQSGETTDTLMGLREARAQGLKALSLCNVVGSTIARESDGVLYTHAGPEIGVASTKAYTAQVLAFSLLALYLGRKKNAIDDAVMQKMLIALHRIPELMHKILEQAKTIEDCAEIFCRKRDFLYLGRKWNYPSALEGALKLKEISYVHASAHPAGEMKHGPIALIDENVPVFCFVPQDSVHEKMMSNIQEVKARKGKVIAIATEGDETVRRHSDFVIYIPKTEEALYPLLAALPLQLFAYYVALKRGCEIDQPRNLAKSVTVE